MKQTTQLLIIIGIFGLFGIFEIYQNTGSKVIKIFSPIKIAVDLNRNNIINDNEIICIPKINSLSADIKLDQQKLVKNLNLTNEDAIKLGYLSDKFAEKLLLNKSIKIIKEQQHSPECTNAQVIINGKNYKDELINNGFGIINSKPANQNEFNKKLEIAKQLKLVIANPSSGKYHTLKCKYGINSADYIILEESIAKEKFKNCNFCIKNQKIKSKEQATKQTQIAELTSYKTSYSEIISTNNIKFMASDFTKILKPNRNCSHIFCKETVKLINETHNTLDIAAYGWADIPEITTAIEKAKSRGVKIRVVYDKRNGREYYPETKKFIDTIKDSRSDENVENKKLTSMLMHNKFIISDNKTLLTGSMNFSTTGFSGFNGNNLVIIKSQELSELYTTEFEQMYSGKFHTQKSQNNKNRTVRIDNSTISTYFSPQDKTIQKRIIPLINNAKKYIYIPAFVITHKELSQALLEANQRGVSIKIIVDATSSGTTHSKNSELKNGGIPIKYENFAGKMHTKSIIIDDEVVITGSMNFSNSGETKNDENALIIENSEIAKYYRGYFEHIWANIPDKWLHSAVRAESKDSIGSCSDGLDNDYDGKIDIEDSGCF